ncbi:MAG: hypothetical protein JO267_06965 [Alphaproteobacteria bacterium]|nr:hypothetical protein [Alphaproteobacteria bacterium]
MNPLLVGPKNPLASKTVWLNLLAPMTTIIAARYGFAVSGDTLDAVAALLTALAGSNLVMRWLTTGPVGFAAPLQASPPVPVPPGLYQSATHEIVVAPPPAPPPPPAGISVRRRLPLAAEKPPAGSEAGPTASAPAANAGAASLS